MRTTLKSIIKSELQPELTSDFFLFARLMTTSLIRVGLLLSMLCVQACSTLEDFGKVDGQKNEPPSKPIPSVDLTNAKWQKFSASQPNENPLRIAILAKDTKVGATRIAIKAPGNFALPTTWFTVQGSYTVLSGTFVFDGLDAKGRLDRVRYYPGDFATLPANYILRISTEGTGEAVLYMTLYGDWAPQLPTNPWNKPALRGAR